MKQYKNIATGTIVTLDESEMMYRGMYMDRPVILHPLAVEGSPMIYEAVDEQFNVGDWVVILNYGSICIKSIECDANTKVGACERIKSIEGAQIYFESGMKMNWRNTNKAIDYEFGNSDKYLRHATKEEIEAAQPANITTSEIKVGDRVKFIDSGEQYDTYSDMFKKLGFKDTIINCIEEGWEGVVFAIGTHHTSEITLYAINFDNGKQGLVSRHGITLCAPGSERKVLHVTHDGVKLHEGDHYWFCYKSGNNEMHLNMPKDTPCMLAVSQYDKFQKQFEYFSTKEACQAYLDAIHNPKPASPKSWTLEQLEKMSIVDNHNPHEYRIGKTECKNYLIIKKSDLK